MQQHPQQPDPFGYPTQNPFTSSAPGTQSNPFSPMEQSATSSYFGADPNASQMHQLQRPPPPGRPQSFIAPGMPGSQGFGSELMPHPQYQHPGMPPYGMHPGMHPGMNPGMNPAMNPAMHPGMHPGMANPAMQMYPQFPFMLPPSHTSSPGPSTVSSHSKKEKEKEKESPKEEPPKPPPGPSEKEIELAKEIERLRVFEQEKIEKEIAAQKAREEAAAKELERLRKFEAERIAKENEEKAKADAAAAEAALKAKEDAGLAQIDALKALIQKHEEERAAREAASIARAESEAAAAAAKKAKEEEEKKRQEEIAAASAAAKEAAEKAAKEAADAAEKAAKDAAEAAQKEHEAKLAEATKAHEEAEKARKALEEAAEKAKPPPDAMQPPIKFKDAVGRKFSFPWHICKTWKGMESLIKQAFAHIDVIGHHVHEGHYDLMGPDGEIILPQVWETMVKPDWDISMHMWPLPEPEPLPEEPKIEIPPEDPFAGLNLRLENLGLAQHAPKPKKAKGSKKKNISPVLAHSGPAHNAFDGMIPPPPMDDPLTALLGHNGVLPPPAEPKSKQPKKVKPKSGFAAWMVGAPPRTKKDDEKLELVRAHSRKSANNGTPASTDQTACLVM